MAKGKPTRAFLEALKQDKKRRGDENPGGGFKTPAWFFNKKNGAEAEASLAPAPPALTSLKAPQRKPFRLNWFYAAGLGIVLVSVVSVAYMAGRQQQPPQFSEASDDIRDTAPQGGVLEPMDRPMVRIPAPVPVAVEGSPMMPVESSAGPGESAGRIVGMNYAVIQSYKEESLAKEAAEALRAGGVGCTVEHGLAGYSSSWYVVVGTTGFTKATTPEYQAYLKKVQSVSEKFAGASKWKRFEPNPYKWR